jgi:hypothetical protein
VIELVRAMENAASNYSNKGETVAQFLEWSLAQLDDPIIHQTRLRNQFLSTIAIRIRRNERKRMK